VFKSDIEKCLLAGMDDHLGKPIDINRVIEVLRKYLGRKTNGIKKINVIPKKQLDAKWSARFFVRDATRAITALEAVNAKNGVYNDRDIKDFILHVHGMKSALAEVGEAELSAVALKLEKSGRNREIETISAEIPEFLNSLRVLVKKLTPEEETGNVDEDTAYLHEKLLAFSGACQIYDTNTAESILADLHEKTWSQQTNNLLNTLTEHLLFSDFDEIIEIIANYKGGQII